MRSGCQLVHLGSANKARPEAGELGDCAKVGRGLEQIGGLLAAAGHMEHACVAVQSGAGEMTRLLNPSACGVKRLHAAPHEPTARR